MIDNTLLWAVIVAFLAIVFVRKSVIIVRQGYEYTVERFGKYSTTFRPGFHIMIPFINRVGQRCALAGSYFQRQRRTNS